MTKDQVDAVLSRVRECALERQAELARMAEFLAAQHERIEQEDAATIEAINEGLAQARRGEFATEEQVEAVYGRFRA